MPELKDQIQLQNADLYKVHNLNQEEKDHNCKLEILTNVAPWIGQIP